MLLSEEPSAYYAQRQPDKIACVDITTGERASYRALAARVAQASGWLKAETGDPVGRRIAFLSRNCIDEIVLFLACQRSGAIFVPLNWRLAAPEIAGLLADCTPDILIASDEFAAVAEEAARTSPKAKRVTLEEFSAGVTSSKPAPATDVMADVPVTLLYTSGTTGRPKGAIITRQNAAFAALNFGFISRVEPHSVLMSDGPLFHTVALFGVVRSSLTYGATAVISDRFLPPRTVAVLADRSFGVTHYFGVPQMADALKQEPAFATADFSHLKAMFCGGAPLPVPLQESCLERGIVMVNGFGMSETGTVMHMPVDRDIIRAHPGSVGMPAPFVDVRIVDGDGNDVPDGETGEIWLRGPGVTPGYWNQPNATAASFSGEWFRSGDLATRRPNGFYYIVDRLKDMYITGGENVYPAEVEAVIATHPAVADVAVVGIPDGRWGESGIAFVVRKDGATLSDDDVLAYCTRLAGYKRPRQVRFLDAIPRTASGKIMKPQLRKDWAAREPQ